MRYGHFLKDHGTIGFVAPSFGCATEPYKSAFLNALSRWEKEGYHLDTGPNCFAGEGIGISNTPKKCGEELTKYYLKRDTDVLISCGGGELMCEVLDYVDFDAIKKAPPKWYMGFSDNTNMTFLLATIADTASVYGPCAPSFGMEPQHDSLKEAFSILTGAKGKGNPPVFSVQGYPKWERDSIKDEEHPLAPYNLTEPSILAFYNGSDPAKEDGYPVTLGDEIPRTVFEGRLLGGCLDCLANLPGTGYDHTAAFAQRYKQDGIIWFLESCDLNVFSIRRAMWQLEHAGWFRYVKGFLFGRPLNGMEPMMDLDRYQAVLEVAAQKNVPVLMDLDLGHLPPMMPLVNGSYARVSTNGNKAVIDMELRA